MVQECLSIKIPLVVWSGNERMIYHPRKIFVTINLPMTVNHGVRSFDVESIILIHLKYTHKGIAETESGKGRRQTSGVMTVPSERLTI